MGLIQNRNAPEVKSKALEVLKIAKDCNKPCGIMVSSIAEAKEMLKKGFSIIAVNTDLVLLRNAADEISEIKNNT